MKTGNKNIYLLVFIGVFLFIFIIGLNSEVSFPASLGRAITAALLFTALLITIMKVIIKLDITVNDPPAAVSSTAVSSGGVSGFGQAGGGSHAQEFVPLTARQIEPHVGKIINNDPARMAQIVSKMGFEEH